MLQRCMGDVLRFAPDFACDVSHTFRRLRLACRRLLSWADWAGRLPQRHGAAEGLRTHQRVQEPRGMHSSMSCARNQSEKQEDHMPHATTRKD